MTGEEEDASEDASARDDNEYPCGYILDGKTCGKLSGSYYKIALCDDHRLHLRQVVSNAKGSTARQSAKYHPLDQFPGVCYFALFPDATVKIGYSNTVELLRSRFTCFSRETGSHVVPLAVIKGGFVAEAVMHGKFSEHRIWTESERFRYCPEIAEYIGSLTADDLVDF